MSCSSGQRSSFRPEPRVNSSRTSSRSGATLGYSLDALVQGLREIVEGHPVRTVDERCELRCRKDGAHGNGWGSGLTSSSQHRPASQPGSSGCLVETPAAEEPRVMRDVESAEPGSDDASHHEAELGDVGRSDIDRIGRRARCGNPVAERNDPLGRPGAREWRDRVRRASCHHSHRGTQPRGRDRDRRSRGCDRRRTRSAHRPGRDRGRVRAMRAWRLPSGRRRPRRAPSARPARRSERRRPPPPAPPGTRMARERCRGSSAAGE